MRVPKVDHYAGTSSTKWVRYQAPVIIPRHPILTNDKQRAKCISQIERKCRSSMEYTDLIKFLRTNMNMDQCEFFPNLKSGKRKGAIEIHHAPFDLYTIVGIIMKKYEAEHDGVVNQNMVAKEVMKCHYQGLIGLIPLSITVHQLVHDGKLIVPLNCVFGRFVEFTTRYYGYIDNETLSMLEENIKLTENLKPEDLSILNTCYVYSQVDGVELPDVEPLKGEIVSVELRQDNIAAKDPLDLATT